MPISHMEALCKATHYKPKKLLIWVARQKTCKCLRLNGGGGTGWPVNGNRQLGGWCQCQLAKVLDVSVLTSLDSNVMQCQLKEGWPCKTRWNRVSAMHRGVQAVLPAPWYIKESNDCACTIPYMLTIYPKHH